MYEVQSPIVYPIREVHKEEYKVKIYIQFVTLMSHKLKQKHQVHQLETDKVSRE